MRLFIAIELSERFKDELCMIQKRIKMQGLKGNFTVRENLHLTLAFIGEYPDPDHVADVLDSISFMPMELALSGFGTFGDIYWAGIRDNEALRTNVKRIRKALADNDMPFDRKKFNPHITLVRKMAYDSDLPTDRPFPVIMNVDHISLMRSERGKKGMIYTALEEFMVDTLDEREQ